jgi:hypothetical protein
MNMEGHTKKINSLILYNNKKILSASKDMTIKIWNT